MSRTWLTLLIVAGLAGGAEAGPEDAIRKVEGQFAPTKPTVRVHYDLVYRFCGIRLVRVAEAVLCATEGVWKREGVTDTPVFMLDVTMDTVEAPEARGRKRLCIHDRMVSVLTNPEADTFLYLRYADQWIRPLFKDQVRKQHLKLYDLQSGVMDYQYVDYLEGTTNTVLEGSNDLYRQGREVAQLVKMMSSVYSKETVPVTFAASPRIYVDMDGSVKPFVARTLFDQAPIPLNGKKPPALRVDIRTEPGTPGRAGRLVMWTVSLRDAAATLGDTKLQSIADDSPNWSMVPLVFDYDLALGSLWGGLREIRVLADGEGAGGSGQATVRAVPAPHEPLKGEAVAQKDSGHEG